MTDDPLHGLHPSRDACTIFAFIKRRGGSTRLAPLLRHVPFEPEDTMAAVDELAERYWIEVVWRRAGPATPAGEPRPTADIDRLVLTRFGRRKFRTARAVCW